MKKAKQTAKKILIILLLVFGGFTLLGGSIFSIAMSVAGWDFSVLNTVMYERNEYIAQEEITALSLHFNTNDIEIYFDETATHVRVEYPEKFTKRGKRITYTTLAEENGVLTVEQRQEFTLIAEFISENNNAKFYLPTDRVYNIRIETDTADVLLDGSASALDNLNITTDTGDILLRGGLTVTDTVTIKVDTGDVFIQNDLSAPSIHIQTHTGDVSLKDTITAEDISVRTSTGDVRLGNLSGNGLIVNTRTGDVSCYANTVLDFTSLEFKVGTGDVSLCLAGTYTDYNADVKTNAGDVFFAWHPNESAPRRLLIRTSTGDIHGVYATK
jgi:DUF4097 and DUF4098 domain-containing protein YvlB